MYTTLKYRMILVFSLVGLALACCSKKTMPIQESNTITPTSLTARSPTRTLTLSPMSGMIEPSPSTTFIVNTTLYPTYTILPIISATLTDTPIPKPTLTDLQKNNLFIQLLQSYNGCSLPCWWGVIPGSTSAERARQSLESLGFVNPYENGQVISVGENLVGKNGEGYITITLEKNNDGIDRIDVLSDNPSDLIGFKKLWKRYSPDLIIETYGRPTRIWLSLGYEEPPGGPNHGYGLLFFYDDQRILLYYFGDTNFEYGSICPSFADNGNLVAKFGMWLSSTENKTPLEELPDSWIGSPTDYQSIEDVSGLSVDEFYNGILKLREDFCFRIPADKWPN